ncbi:MAG: hypothetical protein LKE36_06035 [Bacilli bacterium]|jgi:hypothetical protein|nr:hypothetical protein [Bacilli bacterium]
MIEKGRLNKRKVWHFVVNNLNNNDKVIYSEYGTAELLLENACIEGKKIRELWEDLIIE